MREIMQNLTHDREYIIYFTVDALFLQLAYNSEELSPIRKFACTGCRFISIAEGRGGGSFVRQESFSALSGRSLKACRKVGRESPISRRLHIPSNYNGVSTHPSIQFAGINTCIRFYPACTHTWFSLRDSFYVTIHGKSV